MGTVSNYSTSAGRRWRVRYRTPDHRQTDKRGFRTKREAEEFLAGVEVAKLRGDWVNPAASRVTVGEWAEQWFAAQLQVKPTTRSGYRHSLDKHVLPRWAAIRLAEVRHSDVQSWGPRCCRGRGHDVGTAAQSIGGCPIGIGGPPAGKRCGIDTEVVWAMVRDHNII